MIKIIAAVADNGIIGMEGRLPWKLQDDKAWFKSNTMNHTLVMGMNTFKSLGQKVLPGRTSIVLTRRAQGTNPNPNLEFRRNWSSILRESYSRDIWIIGGGEIYKLFLPHADELILTRVHTAPEGDVLFPDWNRDHWDLVDSLDRPKNDRNDHAFTWEVYRRKTKPTS